MTLAFGLVGFYDDYLKVTKQSHGGFAGRLRLIIEGLVAVGACWALFQSRAPAVRDLADVSVLQGAGLQSGWFFIIFGAFIIVGAGNAVNLTDGLDGLAIGPVMIAARLLRRSFSYVVGNAVYDRLSAAPLRARGPASSRSSAAP